MIQLCKNCPYIKSKMVGVVSTVFWCSISKRNKKNGRYMSVKPWCKKSNPKCPLKI